MASVAAYPVTSTRAGPAGGHLRDTRAVKARTYHCDRLPPGGVRLIDGSPADAVVTVTKGKTTCRYLVAVTGYTPTDGLLTRWQKPNGTIYDLSYRDERRNSCDCGACSWAASARADRRHGDTFGSLGCAKLDAFAAMVEGGELPDPRGNGEADAACHVGEGCSRDD